MRIIGGEFGGQVFRPKMKKWPTRPTTDRAKESLFNILENKIDFTQVEMLDLFSGTGMIGLEGLSRGAMYVTFVDKWKGSVVFIQKVVDEINQKNRCAIIQSDAFNYLRGKETTSWNLIFMDPPYDYKNYKNLVEEILTKHLKAGGQLIVEHDQRHDFSNHPQVSDVRKYGQTFFSFFN